VQRGVDVLVGIERREHQYAWPRSTRRQDASGGVETVEPRHANVHEHDIGLVLERHSHSLLTAGCFSHDLDVRSSQQALKACPDDFMVVCDQQFNSHVTVS
jgi:hypothetical protein